MRLVKIPLAFVLLFTSYVAASDQLAKVDIPIFTDHTQVQTNHVKQLTSQQAYALLMSNPETVFIDVRDLVEVKLYGHPSPIDAVIPVMKQGREFDDETLEWLLEDNPSFLSSMETFLRTAGKTRNDMIIVTSGSGRRAALAKRRLIAAGYTDVWDIPDGYPNANAVGFNKGNAWKLADLPWSYSPFQ